jgi:TolB protein
MDADGANIQRLTGGEEEDYWPRFSPDGTRIFFSKYVNEVRAIWVMDADGSNQRPLPSGHGKECRSGS